MATTISTPSPRALDLVRTARPAVHGEDPLAAVVGDRFEHLGHLHGQLTGRYEHEPERAAGGRPLDDPRQHRHAERQRLARAGARPAAHVVAGEGDGDRRALDLERLGEAGGGEAGVDALGHAELGESGRRLDGREGGDPRQRSGSLDGRPARLASAPGGASPGGWGSQGQPVYMRATLWPTNAPRRRACPGERECYRRQRIGVERRSPRPCRVVADDVPRPHPPPYVGRAPQLIATRPPPAHPAGGFFVFRS